MGAVRAPLPPIKAFRDSASSSPVSGAKMEEGMDGTEERSMEGPARLLGTEDSSGRGLAHGVGNSGHAERCSEGHA